VGSFFSCIAFAASLSRSIVGKGVGGRTQLTALVSMLLIILTLLWVADFFEPLPRVSHFYLLKLTRGDSRSFQDTNYFRSATLNFNKSYLLTFLILCISGCIGQHYCRGTSIDFVANFGLARVLAPFKNRRLAVVGCFLVRGRH